ncbi:hypothetical protein BSKO_12394 [Bryopsis sp. KO-2023]|nr:hypothetical protein BSKO_12394 [Bryopsis sp. KO-2023]
MVEVAAIIIISLLLSTARGSNLDLCGCGTIHLPSEWFDSMSDLLKAIFPNTSSQHHDTIQEALYICNPGLQHGLTSLKDELVEPCLFSSDRKDPRFFAHDSGCNCGRIHTVGQKERIWDISVSNFPSHDAIVGVHMIMACNPDLDPYSLREGQTLKMYCFDASKEDRGSARNSLNGSEC